jgi:hypothetical protein
MTLRVLCIALLLAGCASERLTQSPNNPKLPKRPPPDTRGPWTNLYAGDQRLAALAVIQYPENPYESWSYAGKHPCNIWYAFWDGRVRQIQYRPDGTVLNDFWWPARLRLMPGNSVWQTFDFSYGSDRSFSRHRDPRH